MSKEATREQILEVMDQTRRRDLGKSSYQGFIETGDEVGFQYLIKKIIDKARESFNDCGYEELVMTHVAIAGVTRSPEDIKEASKYFSDQRVLRPCVEFAWLFKQWVDVEWVKEFIRDGSTRDKYLNGYYLAKAILVVDGGALALREAVKIDDLYLRAKILWEISDAIDGANVPIIKDIRAELEKIRERSQLFSVRIEMIRDQLFTAKMATLLIRENVAAWARATILSSINGLKDNRVRAVMLSSIASVTLELDDIESAYEAACENPNGGTWRAMVRALSGIN